MAEIKAIVFDFSRVLLHTVDTRYAGKLNDLYKERRTSPNFDFFGVFRLDEELLRWIKNMSATVQVYLYTSEVIQNDRAVLPKLHEVFGENILSAQALGYSKRSADDYEKLSQRLGFPPQQIIFVDDTADNIKASSLAGMLGIQFFSREQVCAKIQTLVGA